MRNLQLETKSWSFAPGQQKLLPLAIRIRLGGGARLGCNNTRRLNATASVCASGSPPASQQSGSHGGVTGATPSIVSQAAHYSG